LYHTPSPPPTHNSENVKLFDGTQILHEVFIVKAPQMDYSKDVIIIDDRMIDVTANALKDI
jgi:hypothetical protein